MTQTYLRLIGVAALWGGTFIAGRIAAPQVPHFTLAALRFWSAFIVLFPLACWQEGRVPVLQRRDVLYATLIALFGLVFYNLFFLGALELIPASRTALVVALNPIMTAIAMALVFKERLAAYRWVGISLALTGVCIVLAKGDLSLIVQRVGQGELLMWGGASCWAVYTIVSRLALQTTTAPSPLVLTTLTAFIGALVLSIGIPAEWSAWSAANVSWSAWGSILYLGTGGTALGFVWYAQALAKLPAARAAVFNNLVPVFGVLFAALLLNEPISLTMIIGGAIALAGVSLTNWSPSEKSSTKND
jgi:drug/metabolite transporter (DMT)-like permease